MTARNEKDAMPSSSVSAHQTSATATPTMARDKPFGWFLIVTGLVSWLASATLVLERLSLYADPNAKVSCDVNTWISCGSVMKTQQAALLGFPNPFIGVAAFVVIITTGVVLLAGAQLSRWYWIGMQVGVTAGFALVCWFWFQAVYVIATLCPYCMIVWAMMIPLFIWLTVRNVVHGVIPAPPGLTKFLKDWVWVIVGLVYVGVLASIFFKFMYLIIGSNA